MEPQFSEALPSLLKMLSWNPAQSVSTLVDKPCQQLGIKGLHNITDIPGRALNLN